MYFWNMPKLKEELIARPSSEREVLPYLIATLLFYLLAIYVGLPNDFGVLFFLCLAIQIIGTVYGSIWLFNQNGGNDGKQFLSRYFMIGWVATIKLMVIVMPIFILILIVLSAFKLVDVDSTVTGWTDVISDLIMYVGIYWYMDKHIADVKNKANY